MASTNTIRGAIFVGVILAIVGIPTAIFTSKASKSVEKEECEERINQMERDGDDYFSREKHSNAIEEFEEAVRTARECGVSTLQLTKKITRSREKLDKIKGGNQKGMNLDSSQIDNKVPVRPENTINSGHKLNGVPTSMATKNPNHISQEKRNPKSQIVSPTTPDQDLQKVKEDLDITTANKIQKSIEESITIFEDQYSFEITHVLVNNKKYYFNDGILTLFNIPPNASIYLVDKAGGKHLK